MKLRMIVMGLLAANLIGSNGFAFESVTVRKHSELQHYPVPYPRLRHSNLEVAAFGGEEYASGCPFSRFLAKGKIVDADKAKAGMKALSSALDYSTIFEESSPLPPHLMGKPRANNPFEGLDKEKICFQYNPADRHFDAKKFSNPLNRLCTKVGLSIFSLLLTIKFSFFTKISENGTKAIASYDKDLVDRCFQQLEKYCMPLFLLGIKVRLFKGSSRSNVLADGEKRWRVCQRLGQAQLILVMRLLVKGDETFANVADLFFFNKWYGKASIQTLAGSQASLKLLLYMWHHGADAIANEFARTQDFIIRGGCTKGKGTIKRIARFHKNFELKEEFILLIGSHMRNAFLDVCEFENDARIFDDIFLTEEAMIGLKEGSILGYDEENHSFATRRGAAASAPIGA